MLAPEHLSVDIRVRLVRILSHESFSQSKVAALSGVSQSYISKFLTRATARLQLETAKKLIVFANNHTHIHELPEIEFGKVGSFELVEERSRITAKGVARDLGVSVFQKFTQHDLAARILRDIDLLHEFVSYVNHRTAERVRKSTPTTDAISGMDALIVALTDLLNDRFKARFNYKTHADTLHRGLSRKEKDRLLVLARHIASPTILTVETEPGGDQVVLSQKPVLNLLSIADSFTFTESIVVSDIEGRPATAECKMPCSYCVAPPVSLNLSFIETPFDIGSLLLGFLETHYHLTINMAYYYIQRWVHETFSLKYDEAHKAAVTRICRRLNAHFFDQEIVARHASRKSQSNTLDFPFLYKLVEETLAEMPGGSDLAARRAMGIISLLRINRLVRVKYRWEHANSSKFNKLRMTHRTEIRPFEMCVNAYLPLDPTHVLTRIFGRTVNIAGLNFIFRGGVLSNSLGGSSTAIIGDPGTAKTLFSLHLLTDIAARGGFAVYLSLEENERRIADRITTFGLGSGNDFNVLCSAGDSLVDGLREASKTEGGVLLIHRFSDKSTFSVEMIIDQINEYVASQETERAFVLDSINDLYFDGKQPDQSLSQVSRDQLNHLVQYFEDNGFTGVIIGEGQDPTSTIAGITGTVIRLGFQSDRRKRTFEIHKCRNQNYHLGTHDLHVSSGKGISIYPSLQAVRSALQLRQRTQPSSIRALDLSEVWKPTPQYDGLGYEEKPYIMDKSMTVISGPANSKKTRFAAHWLGAPVWIAGREESEPARTLPNTLIVSFRSTVARARKTLSCYMNSEGDPLINMVRTHYRWFHPGDEMTPGQLLSSVWNYIKRERRYGRPIERILFEDIDEIGHTMPRVLGDDERLFWATLHELVTTEPVSSLFTMRYDHWENLERHPIRANADYVFLPDGDTVVALKSFPLPEAFRVPIKKSEEKETGPTT